MVAQRPRVDVAWGDLPESTQERDRRLRRRVLADVVDQLRRHPGTWAQIYLVGNVRLFLTDIDGKYGCEAVYRPHDPPTSTDRQLWARYNPHPGVTYHAADELLIAHGYEPTDTPITRA